MFGEVVCFLLTVVVLLSVLNYGYKRKTLRFFAGNHLKCYAGTIWEVSVCLKEGLERFIEQQTKTLKVETFGFAPPTGNFVVTTDPSLIAKVVNCCHSKMANFESSALSLAPGLVSRKITDPKYILVHDALLNVFSKQSVLQNSQMLFQCCQNVISQIYKDSTPVKGTENLFGLITASILCNFYFNYEVEAFSSHFKRINEAVNLMRETFYERTAELHKIFRLLRPFKLLKFLTAKKEVELFISTIINHKGSPQPNIRSILGELAETDLISNIDVTNELINFLIVGTDTVTKGILAILEELGNKKNERKNSRLLSLLELATTPDKILAQDYFDHYVKEVLRMHPVVMLVHRHADLEIQYDGMIIPKGVDVFALTKHLHFHPRYWNMPDEFQPERWESGVYPRSGTYMPFGGGNRICIGKHFAVNQMKFVVYSLLEHYQVQIQPDSSIQLFKK